MTSNTPFVLCAITVILAAMLFAPALAPAQEPAPQTITVVTSGTGADEKAAIKQALSNAVQQAVGTIVDAETVVDKDDIIQEQILTASNAIVTKYDRVGKLRVESGLVTVKIKAVVEKRGLTERLSKASVIKREVRGQDLFAQAVTELEKEKDAALICRRMFKDFPGNVLSAAPVGELRVLKKDERKAEVAVTVRVGYDMKKYSQWVKTFQPYFEKIAEKTTEVRWQWTEDIGKKMSSFEDMQKYTVLPEKRESHGYLDPLVMMTREDLDDSYSGFVYIKNDVWVPKAFSKGRTLAVFDKQGDSKVHFILLDEKSYREVANASLAIPVLEVVLKDATGEEIASQHKLSIFQYSTIYFSPFYYLRNGSGGHLSQPLSAIRQLSAEYEPTEQEVKMAFNRPHIWVMPYFSYFENQNTTFAGVCPVFHFDLSLDDLSKVKTVEVKISSRNNLKAEKTK